MSEEVRRSHSTEVMYGPKQYMNGRGTTLWLHICKDV